MSADGKLFDIEDSLKLKHLDLAKQKSYYELKRVSVGKQFKQNLLSEMTTLLPDHTSDRSSSVYNKCRQSRGKITSEQKIQRI